MMPQEVPLRPRGAPVMPRGPLECRRTNLCLGMRRFRYRRIRGQQQQLATTAAKITMTFTVQKTLNASLFAKKRRQTPERETHVQTER